MFGSRKRGSHAGLQGLQPSEKLNWAFLAPLNNFAKNDRERGVNAGTEQRGGGECKSCILLPTPRPEGRLSLQKVPGGGGTILTESQFGPSVGTETAQQVTKVRGQTLRAKGYEASSLPLRDLQIGQRIRCIEQCEQSVVECKWRTVDVR